MDHFPYCATRGDVRTVTVTVTIAPLQHLIGTGGTTGFIHIWQGADSRCLWNGAESPLAASSLKAQETFLECIGIITTTIEPLEEVITSETANLLSYALQHLRIEDRTWHLTDPYFTEEEWARVLECRTVLLHEPEELLVQLGSANELTLADVERMKGWVVRKRKISLCGCIAHNCEDDFFTNVLGVLVALQPPLNDDLGNDFASIFLTYMLKAANLT